MDFSDMTVKQIKAVCRELSCSPHDLDDYIRRGDYLVLTDAEADEKAAEYIKESLWAFNAEFILCETLQDTSGVDAIRAMQEKECESCNDFFLTLIEKTCGLESFVESAISADGRGHFLSPYDGNETEAADLFIYRVN